MTKKQERAKHRIEKSKHRKSTRFANFLMRLARRRVKNPAHGRRINMNFCCRPNSLGMPRDQLLARGQQLIGGAAAFYDRNELKDLIPRRWDCQNRSRPTVLTRSYIEENFLEDGSFRDPYYDYDSDE